MSQLLDAINTLKGKEISIPDVVRADLPVLFKELGYKVGVEIGVATGLFTETLAKEGLKIFAVDPWISYPGYDNPGVQDRLDKEYMEAQNRLAPYDVTIIRKKSAEAAQGFKDGSLDFVYIDGHHAFKFVAEDIYEWSRKVRVGGIISGHDFVKTSVKRGPYVCHVKHVVRAYTDAYDIKNWYILGSHHFPKGTEKRDRWRSWMWVKEENYER